MSVAPRLQVAAPLAATAERILLIRLSSIGDVVHALPVAAALKESSPGAHLTWIVEEMSAPIVECCPVVDRVIVIPRARWKRDRLRSPAVWREYMAMLRDLRAQRFDLSLDIHGLGKTGLLGLAARARQRVGWRLLREGSRLAAVSMPALPQSVHRVDWYLDTVRGLGRRVDAPQFPFEVPDAARRSAQALLRAAGLPAANQYVVLNPLGGNAIRRWPADRYAEIGRRVVAQGRISVVVVGADKEQQECAEVSRQIRASITGTAVTVADVSGQTSVKELAAVLEGSVAQVCGDTGSAHIAAALRRPVVSLFGPTDPAHAAPWGNEHLVVDGHIACGPDCLVVRGYSPFHIGPRPGIPTCMENIGVEDVWARLQTVL